MPYYLHKKYGFGVHGDLHEAVAAEAPTVEPLNASDCTVLHTGNNSTY
jgi:hypothetical protein